MLMSRRPRACGAFSVLTGLPRARSLEHATRDQSHLPAGPRTGTRPVRRPGRSVDRVAVRRGTLTHRVAVRVEPLICTSAVVRAAGGRENERAPVNPPWPAADDGTGEPADGAGRSLRAWRSLPFRPSAILRHAPLVGPRMRLAFHRRSEATQALETLVTAVCYPIILETF